jgi:hypothetical protein
MQIITLPLKANGIRVPRHSTNILIFRTEIVELPAESTVLAGVA